ncbi:MAG: hypothetical protein VKJ04_00425 [Vampirovibrionales bacterium]|nr:hypothetical protein [Vampirovibrionales bacterium]
MSDPLLSIALQERHDLETMDSRQLMESLKQFNKSDFGKGTVGHRQVFKDYLLSSEVFYIDSDLQ